MCLLGLSDQILAILARKSSEKSQWTVEKIQISILAAEEIPWGIDDELSAMSSLEPGIIRRLLEENLLLERETATVTRLSLV